MHLIIKADAKIPTTFMQTRVLRIKSSFLISWFVEGRLT
jgi:hypothetical protein